MSTTPDFQKAALWYAKNGLPVFPVIPGGKRPINPHGFKEATTDENQVRRWWSENTNANIGVPTGEPSGWDVVDVDPRNGGDKALAGLIGEHGPLPKTVVQNTGGGGLHYLFKHAQGVRCGVIADGLDRKADGGYIVVAPSVTSGLYSWVGGTAQLQPALQNLTEAPAWAINSIKPTTPAVIPQGGRITAGSRNATLTSLAGSMRRRGMNEESIAVALLAENKTKCEPPLSDSEVCAIAKSVSRYEQAGSVQQQDYDQSGAIARDRAASWPGPLAPEAFHGIAGEIVRMITPHSEADEVALLGHFLVAFGNVVGRSAHFSKGGTRHYTNLSAVVVGSTASGKGSAKDDAFFVIRNADAEWFDTRVQSGLSSGEGLIWAVRDPIEEQQAIKEKGRVVDYQLVVTDPGVRDKRLLLVEPEFGSTLRVIEREGNTLSAQIRQAWDSGNIRVLTKNKAARATNAHISIIGHVTHQELLKYLHNTELWNGFANRKLWFAVRRSKFLPDGGELDLLDLGSVTERLRKATDFAHQAGEMRRSDAAKAVWHAIYRDLAGDRGGLLGAVTNRAAPQTMRLAMIYALLDRSSVIEVEHLNAALAVWAYCEASARYIFGDALGDPTADQIERWLQESPSGLTRTDLSDLFGRNKSAAEIERALTVLVEHGRVRREMEDTLGRPAERWFAVSLVRNKRS